MTGVTADVTRAGLEGWPAYVYDNGREANLVAGALGLQLRRTPPARTDRVVVVVADRTSATKVIESLRTNQMWRPALIVSWGLPEAFAFACLEYRIPVVDGSMIQNPADAIDAITGRWPPARLDAEYRLAAELATLEPHLYLPTVELPANGGPQ